MIYMKNLESTFWMCYRTVKMTRVVMQRNLHFLRLTSCHWTLYITSEISLINRQKIIITAHTATVLYSILCEQRYQYQEIIEIRHYFTLSSSISFHSVQYTNTSLLQARKTVQSRSRLTLWTEFSLQGQKVSPLYLKSFAFYARKVALTLRSCYFFLRKNSRCFCKHQSARPTCPK